MQAIFIILGALAVAVGGYRWYAGFVDRKVIQADPNRVTPAKMYMDGVDFMPTSKYVLFGYQFKSIAGAGPVVGAIIALQWGWLPAMLWLFLGVLFIGWVHDYVSGMTSLRCDGLSLGGLSYKLISPRARLILLSFVYFYLLLLAGAFGGVIAGALIKLTSGPVAMLVLAAAGALAGQMIYRWRTNILVTTVVCVVLALIGIKLGDMLPAPSILGASLAANKFTWGLFAVVFCYISAVLPIWRFALPLNYVAFYIVMFGLVGGIAGILVGLPVVQAPAFTQFTIGIGPLWPILFVTIACGAISGWHSMVTTSGTCRQLEYETDAKPVLAGSMFVEMLLGVVALMTAAAAMPFSQYKEIMTKGGGAGPVFATGLSNFLNIIGLPLAYGKTMGTVIIIVLALTVMQLVLRFMKVATIELVGDYTPILRSGPVATFIAAALTLLLVQTGWWQYLWILFGGANQLLASLALLVASLWLLSQGKKATFTLIPMWFMFITTIAALIYTSYNLLSKVLTGQVKAATGQSLLEATIGNGLMGLVALFLVIAALVLLYDGIKALRRYREPGAAAAAEAK
ncbi:MAG: carbon starvation CstA family protein [Desulfobaccales bacterium]|nr:carbon starvation CstA family protein [Desulfobaccales bacterium]